MSHPKKSELNEYQTAANYTAFYPGRLGTSNVPTKNLLKFLSKNWSAFDTYVDNGGQEILEVLERGMPLLGLLYTCMGLSGEIGELQEKLIDPDNKDLEAIEKELGDVYWYIAEICMELKTPMSTLLTITPRYTNTRKIVSDFTDVEFRLVIVISIWSGRICDKVKKVLRDGNGIVTTEIKSYILDELAKILYALTGICGIVGTTPVVCMKKNTEKLLSRMKRNTLGGEGDNR